MTERPHQQPDHHHRETQSLSHQPDQSNKLAANELAANNRTESRESPDQIPINNADQLLDVDRFPDDEDDSSIKEYQPEYQPRPEEQTPDRDPITAANREFHHRMQTLKDHNLILTPNHWPCAPFLCLTHRTDIDTQTRLPRLALMYEGHPNSIFETNLYQIPTHGGTLTEAEFLANKIQYPNLDDLLKHWQVD